jgi:hypothetical protein
MDRKLRLLSKTSSPKISLSGGLHGVRSLLQPVEAWIAIFSFSLLSLLAILLGAGKVLNIAFPAGASAVGLLLYLRYPILYIGFTWWLWFLTPLVRRLADYHSSFTEPSPILLAPLLVTFISSITLMVNMPKYLRRGGMGFILCFVSICYGLAIGLIQNEPSAVILDFLGWASPIVLGFHLFVNWRNYNNYRQNIQRTFWWGVLVMGLYGIYQYLIAPEWDRFWLTNIDAFAFGTPNPLGIRVWSTMHSPQPFAAAMMAGLLLLFAKKGNWHFLTIAVGYLSFLLSLARSAWFSWAIALLIFLPSLKSNLQLRLIIGILGAVIAVVPLATIEPFSSTIASRLGSLVDSQDDSLVGRAAGYSNFLELVFSQFIGKGLGQETEFGMGSRDSGILTMFFSLGWIGSILYLIGIVLLFAIVFKDFNRSAEVFVNLSRAISVGTFAQIGLNIATSGVIGVILWCFLGMAMAGRIKGCSVQ